MPARILLPFQYEGASHLVDDRVRLLADDMGLGKTAQAIGASETHDDPVTVLAPAMLVREWADELDAWCNVPRDVAIVGAKSGPDPLTAGVTLCSYDRQARPEVHDMLMRRRGAHLILDEAHYLKTPESKRTVSALGDNVFRGLSTDASRVSFLTGTPCPNNAGELWHMVREAGRFDGTQTDFLLEYCHTRQTPYGLRVTGYKNAGALREMLDGFMLRRTDAVVLPPSTSSEMIVSPDATADPAALLAIRSVDPSVAKMVERAAQRGQFDQLETPHLASIRRATGLAKAHAVATKASELLTADPSAKLVLFAIHRDVINILNQALTDFNPVILAGGIPEKKRKAAKERFQSDTETRVALCQMKAAGVGLTLTAGNHLWLVEPSWTPADNDQAKKRILRIGQQRETDIRFVTLEGSIDEAVNDVLRKKRQLIDDILKADCT